MNLLQSPLNYTGSKTNLIPQLLEHFPKKLNGLFIDVFTGGLSVVVNTNYQQYVANDIITPLIKFYIEMYETTSFDYFIEEVLKYKIRKDSSIEYENLRNSFNITKNPHMFFGLVSSCTNNMMRFNNSFKFNQTFGKRSISDKTIEKLNLYHENISTKNITFTNETFENIIEKYNNKDNFFYLDPPYTSTKEFKIEAGYNCYWSKEHEKNLWESLDIINNNNGKFCVSNILNKNGIKNPNYEKFKKWDVVEMEFDYEKVARKKNSQITEIIIKNY